MGKEQNSNLQRLALVFVFALFGVTAIDAQLAIGRRLDRTSERVSSVNAQQMLRDAEFLSSDAMRGRETGTPENAKAREYIVQRFKKHGLKPFGGSYLQEFTFERWGTDEKVSGANVVGYIKGKKNAEKYIVVTAHYDHVGVQEGEIYNGADDNASGTAALMALAETFKKDRPDHSIIFVAFDAEEQGLRGSRHFVANLPVNKESILLNINLDMVARSDKGELYASGTFHYPKLKPILWQAQESAKVKLLLGHDNPELGRDDWTSQSDHGSFHRVGIPFVYFGVEDHKDYHRPTDDFANIQPDFFVKAVGTILDAVRIIDRSFPVGT